MMRFLKISFAAIILLAYNKTFSQEVFHLDTAVARSISAATYDHAKKAVMFFSGNNVFYYPVGATKTVQPEWYNLGAFKKVDAALSWDEDVSLFFDGSSYRMFKHSTGSFMTESAKWPNLPASWNNELDGAVNWDKNLILFFYKNEYSIYDIAKDSMVAYSTLDGWQGWPAEWNDGIDDAFNIEDGYIYFIRAGEVMPYSIRDKAFFRPLKITPLAAANNFQNQSNDVTNNSIPVPKQVSLTDSKNNFQNSGTTTNASNNSTYKTDFSVSGCLTGNPQGSGFSEQQSPVQGDEQGRLYSDNLPKGYKIAEIKIYSSKIWGKNVISGIQCILSSPTGETKEQTVLGRKTISEYSFKLDDDECIKGISGITNGEQGNFIYSVQIATSKRNSQVFGEKASDKIGRSFSLMLPAESVFNGFVGNFNNNMTGIGIKYFGNAQMNIASTQNTNTNSNNTTTNNTITSNNSLQGNGGIGSSNETHTNETATNNTTTVTDGYLDNYEDYTKNLGNDAMWLVQPMPGLDWLGAGFDILRFDPLNPNETRNRKLLRGIVITNSAERGGNKAQYLKPYGTIFSSANSGSDIDSNSWVSSYKEFASSFSVGASGSVKVPEAGGGSLSGSYSEMSSASIGSESIFYFSKIMRKIHELDLELTWRDDVTGQRYKQKLNPTFKEDVAALPIMNGTIPNIDISTMQKGKPLPGGLEQLKQKYLDFIAKYGTHFASHVGWGGQYISRTQIRRSDYEASRMNKVDFTAQAEATIKKVKVGAEVKFGNSEGQTSSNGKSVFRRNTYVQGGNGETDEDKWRDKVDLTPAPVEIFFTPYADMFTKELFPNDGNIERKSKLMKIFTEKYIVDNMRPPVESKNDFFRDLPELAMPGNISVKDGGGFDLQFSVTYELNGKLETKESGRYSLGRTMHLEVPVDSKNVHLKVEYFTGWLSDTKVIFEKTFALPEVKCYTVSGTLFKQSYDECQQ